MATVSATSVTNAVAVTNALAVQQAAVTALSAATQALKNAQRAYAQSMATDGVQISDPNAPIVLAPVVNYVANA
jgi:hypothetical protein